MQRVSNLTEARLDALYTADGFGGDKTMRARVVRELIDEIRILRTKLARSITSVPARDGDLPDDV